MSMSINLSDNLVANAKNVASVLHRSCAKQIEHWASIGKIAEDNPDLTYQFILDCLLSKKELDNGEISKYEFDN